MRSVQTARGRSDPDDQTAVHLASVGLSFLIYEMGDSDEAFRRCPGMTFNYMFLCWLEW